MIGMGWGGFFVLEVFLPFVDLKKEVLRLHLAVTETWQHKNAYEVPQIDCMLFKGNKNVCTFCVCAKIRVGIPLRKQQIRE